MPEVHIAACFNCFGEYDAVEAIWCSCNPQNPTKVCPFCLGCFCAAPADYKASFWKDAPELLKSEVETLNQSKMLIGDLLVRAGLITVPQLLSALILQKTDSRRVGEILVDSGALPADRLEQFLKSQHTVPSVDPARARIDAILLRRIGVDQCLKECVLPLEPEVFRDRQIMTLVMADPSNADLCDRIMKATGCQILPASASREAIHAAILAIFPQGSATQVDAGARAEQAVEEAARSSLVRSVLAAALRRHASHIDVIRRRGDWGLYFRIDGTLYRDRSVTPQVALDAMKEFSAAAGFQAGSATGPSAGHAAFEIDDLAHQVVVRSRPGAEAAQLTVKLIDPIGFPKRLDDLGMPSDVTDLLRGAVLKEAGLIVVCAPEGAGSTNTLYALAVEALANDRQVTLVESPRASLLTGATQIEYSASLPATFVDSMARAAADSRGVLVLPNASGIAWAGVNASLPAQMVLVCRVEAKNLAEGLALLVRAGYPVEALTARPTVAISQRLVRKLCAKCREVVGNAVEDAVALGLSADAAAATKVWRGKGCGACAVTPGFQGRALLCRGLRLQGAVASAILTGSATAIETAMQADGLPPVSVEIARHLHEGRTTPDEIMGRRQARPAQS